ncbi:MULTISPECIES: hypothetical protein [unclassified Streptococcus]|uniref:hypothetical protein n=1 Tax=unclassified Streptococcus TaxID=2608887 RepID=UPI000B0ABAEC|nr:MULTISPECIES: hypothetical protein [unclassified Streptococcus]
MAKANKRYAHAEVREVVAMQPKSGKVPSGSLVKLYYVDEMFIEKSRENFVLPDVVGLSVDEAK